MHALARSWPDQRGAMPHILTAWQVSFNRLRHRGAIAATFFGNLSSPGNVVQWACSGQTKSGRSRRPSSSAMPPDANPVPAGDVDSGTPSTCTSGLSRGTLYEWSAEQGRQVSRVTTRPRSHLLAVRLRVPIRSRCGLAIVGWGEALSPSWPEAWRFVIARPDTGGSLAPGRAVPSSILATSHSTPL